MRRFVIAIVVGICAANVFAEDPKAVVSPNKKLEFRIVEDQPAIYAAGTNDVVLKLTEGVEGPSTRTFIWAPDSRRFAYNYKESGRSNLCVIYELVGAEWKALPDIYEEAGTVSARLDRIKEARTKKLKAPGRRLFAENLRCLPGAALAR